LETSDSLNAALEKYRSVIIDKQPITKIIKELTTTNNLLELNSRDPGASGAPGTSIDELNDIFSNLNNFSKQESNFKSEDILAPSKMETPKVSTPVDIKSLIQPSVSSDFGGASDRRAGDFDLLQDIDLTVKR
jgi:hypothetical protein